MAIDRISIAATILPRLGPYVLMLGTSKARTDTTRGRLTRNRTLVSEGIAKAKELTG
jgi:hypothetical protein